MTYQHNIKVHCISSQINFFELSQVKYSDKIISKLRLKLKRIIQTQNTMKIKIKTTNFRTNLILI